MPQINNPSKTNTDDLATLLEGIQNEIESVGMTLKGRLDEVIELLKQIREGQ